MFTNKKIIYFPKCNFNIFRQGQIIMISHQGVAGVNIHFLSNSNYGKILPLTNFIGGASVFLLLESVIIIQLYLG